jgi:hypothetical protein
MNKIGQMFEFLGKFLNFYFSEKVSQKTEDFVW